ncbi:hypothetical protein N7489_008638 [Penicillium chrysogenum]|uniref:uncharacterized protein n=1 Tax=Penicillium chrysogenum TaxID=5076 RepID=UPI0024DF292F|nr:uncharacterized protein N7489_008638 [Penicillium chrysogenum]KAJ5227930.1 hypothetical protein N7489_008638 [Penicillium chrysogenum]KAJ6167434.1 hypothetical protein N7497_000277 [Penicillium chrysogenum]
MSIPPVSWHSDTGTIYFIGYFHGINAKPKDRNNIKIGPAFLACYGLAKPSSDEWLNKDWNGDTTGWEM